MPDGKRPRAAKRRRGRPGSHANRLARGGGGDVGRTLPHGQLERPLILTVDGQAAPLPQLHGDEVDEQIAVFAAQIHLLQHHKDANEPIDETAELDPRLAAEREGGACLRGGAAGRGAVRREVGRAGGDGLAVESLGAFPPFAPYFRVLESKI